MRWNLLSIKLMTAVAVVSLLTIGVFAWVSITTQRDQLVAEVIRSASQFSDTVKRSTHRAMLENQLETAYHIMDTIGAQEGVEKVRVFNKKGLILFSTDREEVSEIVNKRAESCYACHSAEKPLERLKLPERARIFMNREGTRILGMITPIYNEPSCIREGCHAATKSVLGVLDIALSLAQVDADIASTTWKMALFAVAMVLLVLGTIGIFLQKWVVRPVRELLQGTERVARGDLVHEIPARTGDEIGHLATSFNKMTDVLQRAKADLDSLVETLEEQVEERTKALQDAQDQLIQTEKLASLGKLSASIAHEINNPLSGILTYAKLLIKRLKDGPPDRETQAQVVKSLTLIERETGRCSSIVRNLLDFSRQRKPSLRELDLNAVIDDALSLLANQMIIQGVTVKKNLRDIPRVRADYGQLRQAFVNIALNACEAMGKGLTLAVSSRFRPEAEVVEVEFADTGAGIPQEDLSKIFDPFFTTKEKGTGLGLSVVYGIVSRHGGRIEIKSQVGKGTSVVASLPLAGEPPQEVSS